MGNTWTILFLMYQMCELSCPDQFQPTNSSFSKFVRHIYALVRITETILFFIRLRSDYWWFGLGGTLFFVPCHFHAILLLYTYIFLEIKFDVKRNLSFFHSPTHLRSLILMGGPCFHHAASFYLIKWYFLEHQGSTTNIFSCQEMEKWCLEDIFAGRWRGKTFQCRSADCCAFSCAFIWILIENWLKTSLDTRNWYLISLFS